MKSFSSLFKQEHITFTKNKTSLIFFSMQTQKIVTRCGSRSALNQGLGFKLKAEPWLRFTL